MSQKITRQEFKSFIKNLIIKELREGNIYDSDDNDDNLGIFDGQFDPSEFEGSAMKAAAEDIGDEFVPLGKSKFEKNIDPEEFKSDLERQNLRLPNDEKELANIKKIMNVKKSHEDKFGTGSLNEVNRMDEGNVNPDTKIDRPKDSEGQQITLKARVEDPSSGSVGHVVRFGVDDGGKQTVHIDWVQSFGGIVPKSIVYPSSIIVKDKTRIVREDEENGEAYLENSRYMFFGNLKQMQRQIELILKMSEDEIIQILEKGHDWAQDHVATAKENTDQVFDFLMNETTKDNSSENSTHDVEESSIRSYAIGKGKNLKPGNYPDTLKNENLDENAGVDDEIFSEVLEKLRLKFNKISPEQSTYNKVHGLPADWKGSKEGYHEFITKKQHPKGTNENLDAAVDSNDKMYLVVDNDFNRSHYPDLVGKEFSNPPGYAQVKDVVKDTEKEDSFSESFDYAAQEREYHGKKEINSIEDTKNYVPKNLIEFLVPNTFNITKRDEDDGSYNYNYTLRIKKQADETMKDIENFIRDEEPNSYNGPGQSFHKTSIYATLEKATNTWIVRISVHCGYDI